MSTIAYHTLGCKVNQYETEKIRQTLENAGFDTVSFSSVADAYVINTCSVTSVADSKSRAAVRKALRLNPDAYVVVTGCCVELEHTKIGSIEGVGLVVTHEDKKTIPDRLVAYLGPSIQTGMRSPKPRMRTRAVTKVQDGCDQFCAYCVIPYARRGRTSRPLASVLEELRSLANFGYKEIVLAGIRLGSYESNDVRLPELVSYAAEIDGIERIRLSSIEPWEINDTFLEAMQHPKVCRHLHIPLQSGDDATLMRMNRPYDGRRYREIIEHVRSKIDNIGITTDVIAGFPGETKTQFQNTYNLMEDIGFSRFHVFRFSPRPGTRAAEMPEQVDAQTKKRRADSLIELGKISQVRFAQSQIGKTLQVLVETASNAGEESEGKQLQGLADNYVGVSFAGGASLKGQIVDVKIMGIGRNSGVLGSIDRR